MRTGQQVLQVVNHKYPFGVSSSLNAKVEERQSFASVQALLQKRSEMLRKQEMLSNPTLVQLLDVRTQGTCLVYEWEYVPYSIGSYVQGRFGSENAEIREMASKLLLKKVTYELTILMSYLAKMRIETELSALTIGVTSAEKLKLYLSPRSKMGIRSELFLVSHYAQAKEKLLRELQAELEIITNTNDSNSQKLRATRGFVEKKVNADPLTQSVISSSSRREGFSRPKQKDQAPFKRKMSFGNFNFSHRQDKGQERPSSPFGPKPHKFSCQYNTPSSSEFTPSATSQSDVFSGFDQTQQAILGHSKSVRIELEKMQDLTGKRQRKDSYKVKITTCREYEVEDPSLFRKSPQDQQDIFEYFARKARRQENQDTHFKEESPSPKKDERTKINTAGKEAVSTTAASSPPISPLLSPTSSKNLEERLKEARERSERVLNKMKFLKK